MHSDTGEQKDDFHWAQPDCKQTKKADDVIRGDVTRDVRCSSWKHLLPGAADKQSNSVVNKDESGRVNLQPSEAVSQGITNKQTIVICNKKIYGDMLWQTSESNVKGTANRLLSRVVNNQGRYRRHGLDDTSVPVSSNQERVIPRRKLLHCEANFNSPKTNQTKCECMELDVDSCRHDAHGQPLSAFSVSKDTSRACETQSHHNFSSELYSKEFPTFGGSSDTASDIKATDLVDSNIIVKDAVPQGNLSDDITLSVAESVVIHTQEIVAPSLSETNRVALESVEQDVDVEHPIFNKGCARTVGVPEMIEINSLEAKSLMAASKTRVIELGTRMSKGEAGSTEDKSSKDVTRGVAPGSNAGWFIAPETVLVEDQALEGPVIQLDEDGLNLDYMHVFWVDEESEVISEEDKLEHSVRQMTKREKDRQKKRAMRANPEYREKETAKARLRMKMRRQDPEYREQERRRDRDRRRQARSKSGL
ncbi:uncharacterized protein LOC121377795 [Gigantopelta aegis]|uniref:uncharacterized protein LOC121377795 n=1 Tax=Gigantopelta aegis TaxID=1735272 RepID=UPI001B88A7B8|nr:uncharacterized protein LOC121377795 [Gigantopelta aegis]